MRSRRAQRLLEASIVRQALFDALTRLDPRYLLRNPVMLVTEVGAAFTSALALAAWSGGGEERAGFVLAVSAWLWFTVISANFAEAMAEGRGQAQADALAADAGEHPVAHDVGVHVADLLRADAGELEEHGVDLGLAGGLGRFGVHGSYQGCAGHAD